MNTKSGYSMLQHKPFSREHNRQLEQPTHEICANTRLRCTSPKKCVTIVKIGASRVDADKTSDGVSHKHSIMTHDLTCI